MENKPTLAIDTNRVSEANKISNSDHEQCMLTTVIRDDTTELARIGVLFMDSAV